MSKEITKAETVSLASCRSGRCPRASNRCPHVAVTGKAIAVLPTLRSVITACSMALFLAAFCQFAHAQNLETSRSGDGQAIKWLSGKALDRIVLQPISVSWQSAPLRERLQQCAKQQRIAVLIDRRVDPMIPLNIAIKDVTFEQLLLAVGNQTGLGFCRIGDAYYVGPEEAALFLLTYDKKSARYRSALKRNSRLSRRQALVWEELTTPRAALDAIATEGQLRIENLDVLPHDLMASCSIPPTTLIERLQLVLVQFGCWYTITDDARRLKIIPLPAVPDVASLRMVSYRPSLAEFQTFKNENAACTISRSKTAITVRGAAAALLDARNWIIAAQDVSLYPSSREQQRFTLTVNNPRGAILDAIALQLSLSIDNKSNANVSAAAMEEVVRLDVADVTLDQLLEALLKDSGLAWIVNGSSIELSDAKTERR